MDNSTTNNENVGRGRGSTNTDENSSIRMQILRSLVTQEGVTNVIWKYEFGAQ